MGDCSSNHSKEEEYTTVFRLPKDPDERRRWLDALPNKPMKINNETCRKKGHERPVHPPIFSLPTSYQRQTVSSKPRNVEARNVVSESRRHPGELRNPEPDPDSVLSWDELKEYCLRLETDAVQKDNRIILTEISGDLPTVSFQLKFPAVT